MLGLLLLLVAAVSGQEIGDSCSCTSCLELDGRTYNYVAEDQGDRCGKGCLMAKGNDEICVCDAPINVTGKTTAFARTCPGPVPKTARMSSIYELELEFGIAFPATNCIDGHTNRWPDGHTNSMCHTQDEHAPWLALEFDSPVDVKSATIYNREDCCGGRFSNAEVRVTDTLPTDGTEMFTGGQLLGSFKGPGTDGQVIHIQGEEYLRGRFVLIQQQGTALNLLEVTVEAKLVQGSVPGEVPCISTALDFKAEMQIILNGGPNSRKVCDGKLMQMIVEYSTPIIPSPSPNPNGNAWAWTSGWSVLQHFLELASHACSSPNNCTDRTSLITKMLHYVGFGDESIHLDKMNYVMTVFETARADAAWDYKPFQPTWKNVFTYLNQPEGFQICDGSDCTRMTMPAGFTDAFEDIRGWSYKEVTNCNEGDPDTGCWPEYDDMKKDFEPFDYYTTKTSKSCVQHYIDNFDQKKTKKLWTRAFFLTCFDMNPYFTGEGVGFDPVARERTGPEWWIRGDSGITMAGPAKTSMNAENIYVYVVPPASGGGGR